MKSSILSKNIIVMIVILAVWQCNAPKDWSLPKDDTPPGPVTNIRVTNRNGGALIQYTKPSDPDLMGVKAVYRFHENDILREMWASFECDSILLDGYSNTDEHIVTLYAVDESYNMSKPEQVTINPLTPPIELIRKTLDVKATFGGVRAKWQNPWKHSMNITLYTYDSAGDKEVWDRYFSTGPEDGFTFRSFDAEEKRFYIELSDKWGNYSLPLDTLLTPLFETKIIGRTPPPNSVNIWSQYGHSNGTARWRGEVFQMSSGATNFSTVHDGFLTNVDSPVNGWWSVFFHSLANFFDPEPGYSTSTSLAPMYFIIDMGKKASYNRLKYWTRDRLFNGVYMPYIWYEFEIWGANEVKPLTGEKLDDFQYWTAWEEIGGTDQWKEGWEKLATCVFKFPSGTPNTVVEILNTEDIDFFLSGFEVPIDEDMVFTPFRYLRFVMLKQNSTDNVIQFAEIEFYGKYDDE